MELPHTKLRACESRRTLIAIDLGECSEKIISYHLLLTKEILSEYTIFHCLDGTITENQAHERIGRILQQTRAYLNETVGSTFKIHVAKGNLVEELKALHARENFGTIIMGTNNKPSEGKMGRNAQAILTNLQVSVIAVPPTIALSFPASVCILVEKIQKSSFDFMSIIYDFVSHYDIFMNFVLFAKDKQELEEEKRLIEEYQDFFDSTITFNFLLEQEQTYLNFLEYVDKIHCDGAMIAWNEETTAERSAKETGFVYCSTKLPVLYIKRSMASHRQITFVGEG